MIEVEIHGQVGFLTLNRLKALNALSVDMIRLMLDTLKTWQLDKNIQAVVIRSASQEVFCAGGDIKSLYQYRHAPIEELMTFFNLEFQLNYLLHIYNKPIITLLNGLTMGGGVGIGMHNRFAIAGENIVFAMPETMIGLFPDIGSSHLLNKLPETWRNNVGVFGARLGVGALSYFNLVAAHILTKDWEEFLDKLINMHWSKNPDQDVKNCIQCFKKEVQPMYPPCDEFWRFEAKTFAELMDNIEHAQDPYFSHIQENMAKFSPLSLYATFEKLKLSQGLDLKACLTLDYQLLYHFMTNSDFFEGVRAMMIDKDKHPHWKYQHWQDVPYTLVQSFFYDIAIEPLMLE